MRASEGMAVATASAAAILGADGAADPYDALGYDALGFVFYTHYENPKARELAANPRAALLFYGIRWADR